jgi:hypothetical protein
MIALGEQAGVALDTVATSDDAPPEHAIERAPKARRRRARRAKLSAPIVAEVSGKVITHMTFLMQRTPGKPHPGRRRGIYLFSCGCYSQRDAEFAICDSAGRVIAHARPVPIRSWKEPVVDAKDWLTLERHARDILYDIEPEHDAPLELVGDFDEVSSRGERLPIPAATHENVVRHARFAPGLHIAPFRGPKGELLIVAIAQDGGLDAMWPVTGIDTWNLWVERSALPSDLHRTMEYERQVDPHECAVVDDRLLASDPTLFYKYTDQVLPRRDVIHVCPWFGRVDRTARMIAVTDIFLRAQSFEEFGGFGAQVRGVQSSLTFLRDMREDHIADPHGTEDPISYHPDFTPKAKQQYADSVDRDQLAAAG